MAQSSVYKKIVTLVEEAVFIHQLDVTEVARYVQDNSELRKVDINEIRKIIDRVALSYRNVQVS